MIALFNGTEITNTDRAVPLDDRGLAYGDGLFETMLLQRRSVRFLDAHLARVKTGCERLGMALPEEAILGDIDDIGRAAENGVLKLILTRGGGGRGYGASNAQPHRYLALHPLPAADPPALNVRWCNLRLARNTQLAGIKHLNRLEQVLARREWNDDAIDEGLLLDTEGELVSAISANVFMVRQGVLLTPDLRFCGVRGVMRSQVLRVAAALQLPFSEEPLWPHDLDETSEIFITNAVRGIRSIVGLEDRRWPVGPVAQELVRELGL